MSWSIKFFMLCVLALSLALFSTLPEPAFSATTATPTAQATEEIATPASTTTVEASNLPKRIHLNGKQLVDQCPKQDGMVLTQVNVANDPYVSEDYVFSAGMTITGFDINLVAGSPDKAKLDFELMVNKTVVASGSGVTTKPKKCEPFIQTLHLVDTPSLNVEVGDTLGLKVKGSDSQIVALGVLCSDSESFIDILTDSAPMRPSATAEATVEPTAEATAE